MFSGVRDIITLWIATRNSDLDGTNPKTRFENWKIDQKMKYILCKKRIWSILCRVLMKPLYLDGLVYLIITQTFTTKYKMIGRFTNQLYIRPCWMYQT